MKTKNPRKTANKASTSKPSASLREKAEEELTRHPEKRKRPEHDAERTIHELQVHQVELQMQNEELRDAQEELNQLKEKYAELYEFAPVGYFTFDRLGKILDLNFTGFQLFETPALKVNALKVNALKVNALKEIISEKRAFIGKPFASFIYTQDRLTFAGHLRAVLEERTLQRCEIRLRQAGRQFFDAELQSIAFGSGDDVQCRTVLSDVTEKVQLRQEHESYIRDLESFGSAASHELRGPLVSIHNFSAVLAEDYGDCFDEDGHKVLEIIADKARHMENLLNSLLEFSKISTTPVRKHEIRMNELVDEVCRALVTKKSPRMQLEIKSVPHAPGDPVLLRQVWFNLIGNALKYSAQSARAEIEIGGYIENDEAVYYVRDNGVGFDPKYGFKLFELFQRLHPRKDFPGTGTGLYIVRRIVEKHGGRVRAESQPGKGSTFYFSLPLE